MLGIRATTGTLANLAGRFIEFASKEDDKVIFRGGENGESERETDLQCFEVQKEPV